jgi:hypothetical protein
MGRPIPSPHIEEAFMPNKGEPLDPNKSPWCLFGAYLRHWRETVRGLPQRDLAKSGLFDQAELSRWERGLAHPHPAHVERVDSTLDADGYLLALHALVIEVDQFRRGRIDGSHQICDEEADMHRRAVMQLLTALSTGAIIPAGTVEMLFSGTSRAIAGHENAAVDDWEEIIWEYGYQWSMSRPGTLIASVAADCAEVSRMLTEKHSPLVRDGLLRVNAQLAAVLAVELNDIGDLAASLRAWRMARRSADASGDREVRVWVRSREAIYALWSGRPLAAASRLADDAIEIGTEKPGSGLIRAYDAKALICSVQGDKEQARIARRDVERVFDRLPDSVTDDHATPLWGYPERNLRWLTACSAAFNADTRQSAQATEQAFALFPADFHGDMANLKLVHALNQIHDREIDDGLATCLSVTRAWPISAARRRIITQTIDALPEKARDLPAARDLRALITA